MKTSNAFTRYVTLVGGILFVLATVTFDGKAQCPTDISPYTPSWIHATHLVYFTTSGGCTGEADYCFRDLVDYPVPGEHTYQSVMISFSLYDSCTSDPGDVLEASTKAITNDVEMYYLTSLPACNAEYAAHHIDAFRAACWALTDQDPPPSNKKFFQPCEAGLGVYCIVHCDICRNGNTGYRFNCVNTLQGTPTCHEAPANINDWTLHSCFHVLCGTNP